MGNVMTFPLLMLTGMTTLNNYVLKTSNDEAIWNTSTEAIFIYSEDSATMNTRAFYNLCIFSDFNIHKHDAKQWLRQFG